jgi:hypothetical protein
LEESKLKLIKAASDKDEDLALHVKELNKKKLIKGDWKIYPKKDITEGCDYIQKLFEIYLDDLAQRKKIGDTHGQPPSVQIRKTTLLTDIDIVINDLNTKSIMLQNEANELLRKMREEKRK